MLRGVADVNVLVSALIARSPAQTSRKLVDAAFSGAWQLVVSPHLLEELEDVIHRDKFRQWVTVAEADRFLAEVARRAVVVADAPQPWPTVTRDPDDDYLVALARSVGADVIISGDPHLTGLTDLVPPVLRPADFLARLEAESRAR